MPEKRVEIVSQYVSDMHVLESHILQPLQRQVSQTEDQPDINRALQGYVATTERHIARLEERLQAVGSKDSLADRAQQGACALGGTAAGAAGSWPRLPDRRSEGTGYNDTSGPGQYNQGLSVRRAQMVAAELVRGGVPPGAISIQGFGETHLLVPTGPGVREPQNRRVEIIIR